MGGVCRIAYKISSMNCKIILEKMVLWLMWRVWSLWERLRIKLYQIVLIRLVKSFFTFLENILISKQFGLNKIVETYTICKLRDSSNLFFFCEIFRDLQSEFSVFFLHIYIGFGTYNIQWTKLHFVFGDYSFWWRTIVLVKALDTWNL